MRFSTEDVRRLLDAVAAVNRGPVADDEDFRERVEGFNLLAELTPRLIDAYCATAGIELP